MSDGSAGAEPRPAGDGGAREFERYALVAALTLVGLCLLLADRMRPSRAAAPVPPSDRLLRIRIGGNAPPAPPAVGPGRQPPRRAPAPQPRGLAAGSADRLSPPRATPGTVLSDPPPSRLPALLRTPVPAPAARTCVVASGETLGDIALRELGSARRAREIASLNGLTDAGRIREGQTLQLPAR